MQELALIMVGDRPDSDWEEFARTVKEAKAGDAVAFESILRRYERQVLMTALRLLNGNLEDAKDASQSVFLRLHKYLYQLDENRCFASWLYRMTVNVCRDMNRSRMRHPAMSLEDAGEMATGALGAEETIERSQQNQMIAEALKELPEKERAAIVLRDIEGLTTAEVAQILGSSEVTVRSQISSARVKIKKFTRRFYRRRS